MLRSLRRFGISPLRFSLSGWSGEGKAREWIGYFTGDSRTATGFSVNR